MADRRQRASLPTVPASRATSSRAVYHCTCFFIVAHALLSQSSRVDSIVVHRAHSRRVYTVAAFRIQFPPGSAVPCMCAETRSARAKHSACESGSLRRSALPDGALAEPAAAGTATPPAAPRAWCRRICIGIPLLALAAAFAVRSTYLLCVLLSPLHAAPLRRIHCVSTYLPNLVARFSLQDNLLSRRRDGSGKAVLRRVCRRDD